MYLCDSFLFLLRKINNNQYESARIFQKLFSLIQTTRMSGPVISSVYDILIRINVAQHLEYRSHRHPIHHSTDKLPNH